VAVITLTRTRWAFARVAWPGWVIEQAGRAIAVYAEMDGGRRLVRTKGSWRDSALRARGPAEVDDHAFPDTTALCAYYLRALEAWEAEGAGQVGAGHDPCQTKFDF
jgi:hypothetical protein